VSPPDDALTLHELLGLRPTDDARRWQQVVGPDVTTPAGALQGGAALAAAMEAAQSVTGRPLRWATAQFVSHVQSGAVVDIDVATPVSGPRMSQVRATACCAGSEILTMLAALGERPFDHSGVWPLRPAVPPPEECPERLVPGPATHSMVEAIDRRSAMGRSYTEVDGHPGPGRSASWFRLPGGTRSVSAGDLAVFGDFLVLEFADALGVACTGASLDNTVRVANLGPTEWVLLDASIHAVTGGLGYGQAHLWSEQGALLGTTSQTLVLRSLSSEGALPERQGRRVIGKGSVGVGGQHIQRDTVDGSVKGVE
jgi:acyl-CoA thioesterase II